MKVNRLNFSVHFINQFIQNNLGVEIDFERYEVQLNQIFDELEEFSTQTDVTFSKMVNAQRTKQLKGFDKMKKRLIKAEKRKQSDKVERLSELYDEVYPHSNLQERIVNFSELYLEYGNELKSDECIYKKQKAFSYTLEKAFLKL